MAKYSRMQQVTSIDATFRALGDPTRRRVIERLRTGPASMTELSRPFDIALPSLAKHLGILERSGLVRSTKLGRVRTYRLVPDRLRSAEHWLSRQRTLWERRLDQLDTHLKTMEEDDS
jgi:DNA-binding transcriptional ArsR family regulator